MPTVLLCVGCQRTPGLPGWGLLRLAQKGTSGFQPRIIVGDEKLGCVSLGTEA
jgi:hypothetical protein